MENTDKDEEVLDSWKEIAAFLKRGVRTVQRWERTEKLPVRRHHHQKRGSVYALRSELDSWRQTREDQVAPARAHAHMEEFQRLRVLTRQQATLAGEVKALLLQNVGLRTRRDRTKPSATPAALIPTSANLT